MLKKGISFFGVFSIATGAMISSGIFILPGLAFAMGGPAVFLSYALAGVLALLGILSAVELATAMPKAGGDYYFVNKSLGPMFGTITGFLGWSALSLKSAFAVFGMTEIISSYIGINYVVSGAMLCIIFTGLNIAGIREATTFQIVLVIALFLMLIVFIFSGITNLQLSKFNPLFQEGISPVFLTAGYVFVTFGGLLQVANISEEIKNPKRNIPLGIILSVMTVTLLYTMVIIVVTGTLRPGEFTGSITPVADSARHLLGSAGFAIIIIASLVAFISTANAGIMAAARYPMALSRDNLLPQEIAVINKRFRTPITAIIITGVLIFLALLLPLETLVEAASTVILASFVLTNLSVIIMRESKLKNYRPSFRAPFYPWLQIFSILIFTLLIIYLGSKAAEISIGLLITGLLIYFLYGRRHRKTYEFAFLRVIQRQKGKKLTHDVLDEQLHEVLIDRDNIEQVYFERLVEKAIVRDLEGPVKEKDVLESVSVDIAEKTGVESSELLTRLREEKKEEDVDITDFSAVYHIEIPGKDNSFMAIVRCRQGIKFPGSKKDLKAMFLLGGTKERKSLHLRTLAYIVKMTDTKEFKRKWLTFEDPEKIKSSMIIRRRIL